MAPERHIDRRRDDAYSGNSDFTNSRIRLATGSKNPLIPEPDPRTSQCRQDISIVMETDRSSRNSAVLRGRHRFTQKNHEAGSRINSCNSANWSAESGRTSLSGTIACKPASGSRMTQVPDREPRIASMVFLSRMESILVRVIEPGGLRLHAQSERVDEPEPVVEQEFQPGGEQGDAAHHGVAEAGAEGDHQHPDADPGEDPHRPLVLDRE